ESGNHRRKDINAAHHHHLVTAADDLKAKPGSAADTRPGPRNANDVARAKPHQRLAQLVEVGQHKLARDVRRYGKRLRRIGIDQFRIEHIIRHEMKVGVVNALAREIAENIRDAIVRIPGLQPPDRFQPPPEIRAVESRLTAEQAELQAKIGRTYPREMLGN